jgi:hypothetical protein
MSANSQLLTHLAAVKKFLDGMHGADCFGDVVKSQSASVQMALQCVEVSLEDGQKIIDVLRDMKWPPEVLQSLLRQVGEKIGQTSSGAKTKLQSFEAISGYFTAQQWTVLLCQETDKARKLDLIVGHAVALGLRNPSEPCYQSLAALYLLVSEGHDKAYSMQGAYKHEVLKHTKRQLKKAAQSPPLNFVLVLDLKPSDFERRCPDVYHAVFSGAAAPESSPLNDLELKTLASTIPMRSTSKVLAQPVPLSVEQSQQGLMQMAAMFQQMMGMGGMGSMGGMGGQQNSGRRSGEIGIQFLNDLPRSNSSSALALALSPRAEANDPPRPAHAEQEQPARAANADRAADAELGSGEPKEQQNKKKEATPKLSVDEATSLVMASLNRRENRKRANFDEGDSADPKKPEASPKAKAKASPKAKAKACPKASPKAKAKKEKDDPKTKAQVKKEKDEEAKAKVKDEKAEKAKVKQAKDAKGGKPPSMSVEWTRNQVLCRTGLVGPGQSVTLSFKDGGKDAAIRKGRKWVAQESKRRGF